MSGGTAPSGPAAGSARGVGGATLCGFAVFTLGLGVMWRGGQLSIFGLLLLALSTTLSILALRSGSWEQDRLWWAAITAVCALTMLLYPLPGHQPHASLQVAFVLALALTATAAAWTARRRLALVLIGLAWLSLLGLVAASWTWGFVEIDFFSAVSGASEALLHGGNPYTPVFSYVMHVDPTVIMDGRFVYGPIVPVLAAPGRLVGDVRVMSVVAVTAMVLGLWHLAVQGRPGTDAHRIAALGLASPLSAAMIHQGWVDVYMMAGLVWWLALRRDHRAWSVVALTVGLLVKPTSLLLVVPWFIWSKGARREIVIAVAAGLAFCLPFALATGISAFVYAVLGLQIASPFRQDSLNLAALIFRFTHVVPPTTLLPLLILAVGAGLLAWRGRPAFQGELAVQAAILQVLAFVLAKQAFFNYYFPAEILLVAGLAASRIAMPAEDVFLPFQERWSRLVAGHRRQPWETTVGRVGE